MKVIVIAPVLELDLCNDTNGYHSDTAVIGRNLWRPSGPTALLKQGHVKQVAQDCDSMISADKHPCSPFSLSRIPCLVVFLQEMY